MNDYSLLAERASALLEAHQQGSPLVLPTVWDAWSARAMVAQGFTALSIGSHPLADSMGFEDGEKMSLPQTLDGVRHITDAVTVPVSADLESGYDTPAPELVSGLLGAGAVGLNIEDTVHSEGRLRTADEHAEYIADIRRAAEAQRIHVVINARTDVFTHAAEFPDPVAEVIHRLNLCAEAGADSVYPVAMPDTETLRRVVAEVNLPLNVTAHPVKGAIPDELDLAQLAEIGVGRVTFGPMLQKAMSESFAPFTREWHNR